MRPVPFTFGDTEDLCNEVLALVRAGKKTVTCAPLSDFGTGKDPMSEIARFRLIEDFATEGAA